MNESSALATVLLTCYAASAMIVMATLYGVYMELTQPEKDAYALVLELRNQIAGRDRAIEIYRQGIQDAIKVTPKASAIEVAFNRRKDDLK